MEKLVKEIIALCRFKSKINATIGEGLCGVIIVLFFLSSFVKWTDRFFDIVKDVSTTGQEIVSLLFMAITYVVLFYVVFYLIKYLAKIIVPLVRFGFTPINKNRANSIESIMTDMVEDKHRMHKAIVKFLRQSHAPRHFAALYIWLSQKHLIDVSEQNEYLDVLKTDYPEQEKEEQIKDVVRIPPKSTFSEAKKKLEDNNYKEFNDNGYPQLFKYHFESFLIDDWDSQEKMTSEI